jgi:hypothetical protein
MQTSVFFRQSGAGLLVLCLVFFTQGLFAQNIAINEDGSTAHPSAILDVKSSTKGVLFPRMTKLQRTAILLPATGLLVYQTDEDKGFYFYNGSTWKQIINEQPWFFINNNLIASSNDFDAVPSLVGIGTNSPSARLHVVGRSTPNLLTLENAVDKAVNINLTLERLGAIPSDAMHISAAKNAGDTKLSFTRRMQSLLGVTNQNLVEIASATNTPVLKAFGDVQSTGAILAQTGRFIYDSAAPLTDLLKVSSDEKVTYGVHVDLTNTDHRGNGLVAHVSGTGHAVIGSSKRGNGAQFSSEQGMALVTTQGKTAFGGPKGDGQVTINDQGEEAGPELLLYSDKGVELAFRKKVNESSFQELQMVSNGRSLSIDRQETVVNPNGEQVSVYKDVADFATNTHALELHGNAKILKEVNTEANSGANMLPIAYGTIYANGLLAANSNNISCIWNAATQVYEITIVGENYAWANYITNVTPIWSTPLVTKTHSQGGKLIVELYALNGAKSQGVFQFTTFKP